MNNGPVERGLYTWEIQEARLVFGNGLVYEQVRIHEGASWTNALNRWGARLKRIPYVKVDNAVTLGNHIYFPVRMPEQLFFDEPGLSRMAWLIHEMTHAWQYQQMGWRYLALALAAQFRYGAQAYEFGGEAGLLDFSGRGQRLTSFNLEQQGDIARSYYLRICSQQNTHAWQPYIADLQRGRQPVQYG